MAMAIFLLLRRDRDGWCGLACGLAVACRPTGALLTVANLLGERRRLVRFILGGLPVAVLHERREKARAEFLRNDG